VAARRVVAPAATGCGIQSTYSGCRIIEIGIRPQLPCKGKRGQFYQAGARVSVPVYLDDQVQATLAALASAKGVELSVLVNELLRKDIELIELGR